jgi:hypothetical protein
VQDERVAVGVLEEGHVANARISLADELDALFLELGTCGSDVVDAKRDAMARPALELDALVLRSPNRQRHVASLEFRGLTRVLGQLEDVSVEGDRALDVTRRDVDEIDSFDPHQGVVPSAYGA